jgi:hypothetical protein
MGQIVTVSDGAGRSVTVSNWGVVQSSRHRFLFRPGPGYWWSVIFYVPYVCPPPLHWPQHPETGYVENITWGSAALEDSCHSQGGAGGKSAAWLWCQPLPGQHGLKNMLDQLSQLMWPKISSGSNCHIVTVGFRFWGTNVFFFKAAEQFAPFGFGLGPFVTRTKRTVV